MNHWKEILKEKLPLMGHRNWIVVTDMAYPLQTNPGIQTLFSDEPYEQTVAQVSALIDKAPHVFAHVYLDSEQQQMSESLSKGWNDFQQRLGEALPLDKVVYVPHEELIVKLDEVSKLFQVIIIKTPLVLPYSSTFFELDCGYWDADREAVLRK